MAKPPSSRPPEVRHHGKPFEPLRDLYFHLMNGSWGLLVGFITISYLAINAIFALLYMLGGDSVSGIEQGVFSDYFFFSVQTMSTIGYGAYSPKTDYGEIVMTAEALTGLLCTALATGLVFGKFSRPNSKILFANHVVITTFRGVPTLMMRVANGRGNDVVDASISVAVLLSEETDEGHRMARLHSLKLVRDHSPIFALSWMVMHHIDEDSPLFGMTEQSVHEGGTPLRIVVTVTGIDGTFSQAVYGRHTYGAGDLLWNHRYIDAIHNDDDGTPVFVHGKFHLTEPDPVSD